MFSGSMNVLLWLSYVVMLSLYALAFGSYAATTFLPHAWQDVGKHVPLSVVVLLLTGLNLLSAKLIGKAESWIVGMKVAMLMLFVGTGFAGIQAGRIAPDTWSPPLQLVAGGMIIFLAYEGFELVANTAPDVRDAARTLPRAYYIAVGFVIALYLMVALVTVGNLPLENIVAAKDYALAEAIRPFLGHAGFVLIAIAAMLSTASAINATLYGAGRLSYSIAADGQLPAVLQRKVWNKPVAGLLITAALTLLTTNAFDLTCVATLGSGGFLLIFAAVNLANALHAKKTQSRAWVSILGAVACLTALATLVWQTAQTDPDKLWVLVAMIGLAVLIEGTYRLWAKRSGDMASRSK